MGWILHLSSAAVLAVTLALPLAGAGAKPGGPDGAAAIGITHSAPPSEESLQEGTVTGRVVDARSLAPLASVQVYVPGTDIGGLTAANGRYLLVGVPAGSHELRVERIGYRAASQQVVVRAGAATEANFELEEEALRLDEIVVTGTAGGTQARAIGNSVTRVEVSDLMQVAPYQDVQGILSVLVPGVTRFAPPGDVGTGGPMRVRGISSMTLSSVPIIYVDGVRVDNSQQAGPKPFRAGRVNRLNDINPEEIESIEVIKGPAAATLFGTEASTGVIVITTKKGAVGRPVFDLSVKQGATWLADPSGKFPTAYDRDPQTGQIRSMNLIAEEEAAGRSPFRTGHNQGYALGVAGGSETFRYYFSGQFQRTEGMVDWNWQENFHARSNLNFTPSDKLDFSTNMGFLRSTTQFASSATDLSTQIVWTLPQRKETPTRGYRGSPPEAIATVEALEKLDRFVGGLTVRHRPVDWFTQRITVGTDVVNSVDSNEYPRHPTGAAYFFRSSSLGAKDLEHVRTTFATLDYAATASWNVTPDLAAETSAGTQYYSKQVETSSASGREYPVPGYNTVAAAALRTGSEDFIENKTFGLYVQEQLGWKQRAFLTAAVRGDDNSAFGANFDFVVYPKLSATWVIHEEPFWNVPLVNALKLRAAWGRAGKQPDVFAARRLYEPLAGPGDRPGLTPAAVGNSDLKPEVGEELELGFDASVLNERVSAAFTYYNKKTKDAIVPRTVAPSSGFPGVQFVNVGELANRGIELELSARLLERRNLSWDVGFSLATNHSEVVSLGGLPPLALPLIQGVATGQRHVEGYPIAGIWDHRVVSAEFAANGKIVNAMCEGPASQGGRPVPCSQAEFVFWGPAVPTYQGGGSTTLQLFRNIRLYALVDFMGGHKKISGDLWGSHVVFRNSLAINERKDPILAAYDEILRTGSPAGLIDGSFAKLRDLSLVYTLSERWAGRLGASRGSVSFATHNVATLWWKQPGTFGRRDVDPEAANADHTEWGGYYQTRLPPSTTFTTTVRLTF